MRVKGNILLILMVMLLFASAALFQLSEDNYLAYLIAGHVENLSSARKTLDAGFKQLLASPISQACYSDTASCQIRVSGVTVDYALHQYQQEDQEACYLQYMLRVRVGATSIGLRAVIEQESNSVVSWMYF